MCWGSSLSPAAFAYMCCTGPVGLPGGSGSMWWVYVRWWSQSGLGSDAEWDAHSALPHLWWTFYSPQSLCPESARDHWSAWRRDVNTHQYCCLGHTHLNIMSSMFTSVPHALQCKPHPSSSSLTGCCSIAGVTAYVRQSLSPVPAVPIAHTRVHGWHLQMFIYVHIFVRCAW